MNNEENDILVDLVKGKSRKTGKDYECVRVRIGDWVGYCFPRSTFEYSYLHKVLGEANDN